MSGVGVCFSSPRFWAGGGLLRAGENPMMSGVCVCFFPALVFGLAEASIALERSCGFAVVCVWIFLGGFARLRALTLTLHRPRRRESGGFCVATLQGGGGSTITPYRLGRGF